MRLVLVAALVLSANVSFASEFQKNAEGVDVKVVSQSTAKLSNRSLQLLKKNLSCVNTQDRGGRPIAIITVEKVDKIANVANPSIKTSVDRLYTYADNCNKVRSALRNPKALSLAHTVTIEKATHVVPEGVPAEGTYCKIMNIEKVELQSNGRTVDNITGYVTTDLMDWTKGSCDQF